jgi:hypothetical protein
MGLDQWAKATKGEATKDIHGHIVYDEEINLCEWRKHPNLQGWMESLWIVKGGSGEFNCVPVELTREDLENLRKSVDAASLPQTSGFFFGSDSDDYYKEQDLDFIKQAIELIEEGYTVTYSSWW